MSWRDTTLKRGALALAVAGALALTGCGFRPLYGEGPAGPADEQLAEVRIGLIPDRSGQILRNFLIRRFNPEGRPATPVYGLDVALQETQQDLNIQRDDTATRANLIIVAQYTLVDLSTGTQLTSEPVEVITSYNILNDQYATLIVEEDARERALRQVSEDIRTRVALYLNREPDSGEAAARPG
jgi:LPS-assembly lipoprotein